MKRAVAFVGLAALALAAPAYAAKTPERGALDGRVRFVDYHADQVFSVTGVYRSATQIVFSADEKIAHVALGDTISWEVAPAENMLFIKPREFAGPTNLIVTTRTGSGLRSYNFELSARKGAITASSPNTFFQVRFRYPEEERRANELAILATKIEQAKSLEQTAVKSALDLGVLEGTRNFAYTGEGSVALQPSEISDNGVFTIMRFPNQREIPAIFQVLPDGTEAIVPFDVRDDFIVIHGLAKEFRLRRGTLVLSLFNENPNYYGEDYKTDTASPLVERVSKVKE